jgi:hypothetical protein
MSKKEQDNKAMSKEIVYVKQNNYLVNILVFCLAITIGIILQYNTQIIPTTIIPQEQQPLASSSPSIEPKNDQIKSIDVPAPFDMNALYKEMSEKLKKEILESIDDKKQSIKKEEDLIVNSPATKVVSIDSQPIKEEINSEIRLTPKNNEKIVLDSNKIKLEPVTTPAPKKTSNEQKQPQKVPNEVKNFKTKKISEIKPKKMWIPIPNSNGGHRRVPASEIKPGKEHHSSVKIWLYEEFLSQEECDNLIKVHEHHLKEILKQKPIICFDSVNTLRMNLKELNREKIADLVTPLDFTPGTMCINQTFSRQLEKWGLKWSFSTAFYPGESKFATVFSKRIEEATQLNETHGGKFQITSYPFQVGYKQHTDCLLDSDEKRDRYATFLVYLNDMGADGGGQTLFPELGIDVKPRQGRALTWNNMNYNTEKCESTSIHSATKIEHPTKKKHIIQRWYYLKNFYALGKRTDETDLPERPKNTPKVSCDEYEYGSCRLYGNYKF